VVEELVIWYNPLTWFPYTREGRQTLIYLALAGCGPALTLVMVWAMTTIRSWADASAAARLDKFATLAYLIGAALLIIVTALACFVSIRAVKISKDGFEATGGENSVAPAAAAQAVADTAQATATAIKDVTQ
jgi:hypothetical protein